MKTHRTQPTQPTRAFVPTSGTLDRRRFLKTAAGAAGLLWLPRRVWAGEAPAILSVKNPNSKLQLAVVGLGGISGGHTLGIAREEHLVAVCECDPVRYENSFEKIKAYEVNNVKPEDIRRFVDYREMLAEMKGKLDGVVVCTPDHNHAIIGMDCIKQGVAVFIEKPMSHNIHEAYALRNAAKKHGVATAMGNEGHTSESAKLSIERLLANQLGPVTEVYHWLNSRSIGGSEEGMEQVEFKRPDWWRNLWSVPVPLAEADLQFRYREGFPTDPLAKENGGDRRWMSGSLGDWGPHLMDVAYCGLRLGEAPTWKIECIDRLWGGERLHYKVEIYRWTIPARGDMPAVQEYWYSGMRPNPDPTLRDEKGNPVATVRNLPEKALQIQKEYDFEMPMEGGLIVGERGVVVTSGGYGIRATFPRDLMKDLPAPPRVLPRIEVPKGVDGNRGEWYHAIRTGEPATTNFDYAAPFNEHYLSGLFASRAPMGTVIEYDVVNHQVTSHPELNQFLTRKYREGYEV